MKDKGHKIINNKIIKGWVLLNTSIHKYVQKPAFQSNKLTLKYLYRQVVCLKSTLWFVQLLTTQDFVGWSYLL